MTKVASVGGMALYRDEEDADAVSMRTTNQVPMEPADHEPLIHEQEDAFPDYSDDIPDVLGEPPAYSDQDGGDAPHTYHVPSENPHIIAPLKTKGDVDIIMDPRFDYDPAYMEDQLKLWSRTPPAQMIRLKGTHTQTTKRDNKERKETVVDFDIQLRLTEYLFNHHGRSSWMELQTVDNGERAYRGGICRTRASKTKKEGHVALEAGKPSLTEWCHRYCASHASMKTYVLSPFINSAWGPRRLTAMA
jgi:hypothetical protein